MRATLTSAACAGVRSDKEKEESSLMLRRSSSAVATSREGQRPSLCFILSVPLLLSGKARIA